LTFHPVRGFVVTEGAGTLASPRSTRGLPCGPGITAPTPRSSTRGRGNPASSPSSRTRPCAGGAADPRSARGEQREPADLRRLFQSGSALRVMFRRKRSQCRCARGWSSPTRRRWSRGQTAELCHAPRSERWIEIP
jgi:hypothetical protein